MNLFDPREPLDGWGAAPPVYVDDVIRRWTHLVLREDPWSAMPRDDVRGTMRSVMSELLNEARDLDDRVRRQRLAAAASEHGAFRAGQLCAEEQLVAEFGFVAVAIEGALRRVGVGERATEATMLALDAELCLAERAALRAWGRAMVCGAESRGWIAKLLDDLR